MPLHHLKRLKLPTFLRKYEKLARPASCELSSVIPFNLRKLLGLDEHGCSSGLCGGGVQGEIAPMMPNTLKLTQKSVLWVMQSLHAVLEYNRR